MSAISDVYDALITRTTSVLTSHTRLSNPYKLDENPDILLRQGYGLAIGAGENSNREFGCRLSIRREFTLSIVRRYAATDLDASGKGTTEKQIMEDAKLLVADFEENTTLTTGARIVKFLSDSGIQYVRSETDKFMYCELIIETEYFETI